MLCLGMGILVGTSFTLWKGFKCVCVFGIGFKGFLYVFEVFLCCCFDCLLKNQIMLRWIGSSW